MIETTRLTIFPLTLEQLLLHTEGRNRLERTLGLPKGKRETSDLLRRILLKFTVPRLRDSRLDPLYHTLWIAIDRNTRLIVAEAKFKGEPDENQTIEIGYGTHPAFQRQGYMTELVGGLLTWARQQPGIQRVEAETAVENVASQKVVEKNGFRLFDRREDMLWWEWWPEPMLTFDSNGYLVPYQIVKASELLIERTFVNNQHRNRLWTQFLAFQKIIVNEQIPVLFTWIDGSFTTQSPHPNDIDLAIFIPEAYKNKHYQQLKEVSAGYPLLHQFWIGLWPDGESALSEAINRMELFKWQEQFNTDREGKPKGIIRMY
jgi:[ribosomal protein S5]-alanine N-acetyltransferase